MKKKKNKLHENVKINTRNNESKYYKVTKNMVWKEKKIVINLSRILFSFFITKKPQIFIVVYLALFYVAKAE